MKKKFRRPLQILGIMGCVVLIVASGYMAVLDHYYRSSQRKLPYRWDFESEEHCPCRTITIAALRVGVSAEAWDYTVSAASNRLVKQGMSLVNIGSVEAVRLPANASEINLICRSSGLEADIYVLIGSSYIAPTLLRQEGENYETIGWAWLYDNRCTILGGENPIRSAEVLLHEMGHMAGLRHSEERSDIMYSDDLMPEQRLSLVYMVYLHAAIDHNWWQQPPLPLTNRRSLSVQELH